MSGADELATEVGETAAVETVAVAGRRMKAAPRKLCQGDRLGRYVVIDELGAGAMGVVYSAYDPALDRRVAIKLLLSQRRDAGREERLIREARALAKLADPHVVAVFDVGRHEDDVFLAMELVDGDTLERWLETPRRPREILRVFIDAGRGLVAAHAAELVHRDFKPANVMIDAQGRVRVMDFGLVAAGSDEPNLGVDAFEGQDASGEDRLTRTGAMLGTPHYMAAEQFARGAVTAASDQFSFCVALHEALSGAHPFGEASTTQARVAAISMRSPESLNVPGVSARTREAIRRGLAADPQARWPTMQLLLDALERQLRPRARLWIGAAAAAAVITTVAVARPSRAAACPTVEDKRDELVAPMDPDTIRRSFEASERSYAMKAHADVTAALSDYATQWSSAYVSQCEASRLRDGVSARVHDARAACLDARRRDYDSVVGLLARADPGVVDRASELVGSLRAIGPCSESDAEVWSFDPPLSGQEEDVTRVRAELSVARAACAAGKFEACRAQSNEALRAADTIGYAPLQAEAHLQLGIALAAEHDIDEAQRQFVDASWLAMPLGHDAVTVEATLGLVELRRNIGLIDDTMAWGDRLDQLLSRHYDATIETRLEMARATVLRETGEYERALPHAQRALDLAVSRFGRISPQAATAIHQMALSEFRLARLTSAHALADEAREIRELELGADHPSTGQTLQLLAAIVGHQSRHEEAMELQIRALAIARAAYGPRGRLVAGLLSNHGSTLEQLGRSDEARASLQLAAEIWIESGHGDSAVYAFGNLAGLSRRHGQWAASLEHAERAWQLIESTPSQAHALKGTIAMHRALAVFGTGDVDRAERLLARAQPLLPTTYTAGLSLIALYQLEARRLRAPGSDFDKQLEAAYTGFRAAEPGPLGEQEIVRIGEAVAAVLARGAPDASQP